MRARVAYAPNPSPDPTPTPSPDPQPQYRGFVDVPADSWYVESGVFDYALDHGLMRGYGDGSNRFGPDDSIIRAMAVTVLWRMAGEPACEAADFDDADYSEDLWYKDAVRWARASEVVKGYEGTNCFGPNDPVTREQLAVMVEVREHRFPYRHIEHGRGARGEAGCGFRERLGARCSRLVG